MLIYSIDQGGWVATYDDLNEVEGNLEYQDVERGEYVIIDSKGSLYESVIGENGFYGYKLKETNVIVKANIEFASKLSILEDSKK